MKIILILGAGLIGLFFSAAALGALLNGDLGAVLFSSLISVGCFVGCKTLMEPPVYEHERTISVYKRKKRWWE